MKNRSIRARACSPALSVLSLAFAATVQAQGIEIDPVVISASRTEQKFSDVLPSASVITREEIERSQAPTLVDLLQGQAGVEIGRNGGPGAVSSLFMRGQASNSVAVFIDGVRVQTDHSGTLKLIDIPPHQIEKVEILRGNSGAVYGEAATGGVINIFTRVGQSGNGGASGYVSYGSRNTTDLSAGYSVKSEDVRWSISAQRFETDGFSAVNHLQQTSANPDRDGLKRSSVFIQAERKIEQKLTLGFQANRIDGRFQYDDAYQAPTDSHHNITETSNVMVFGKLNLNSQWASRLALAQSKYEANDYFNGAPSGSVTQGKQKSLQWSNVYRLGLQAATFGFDLGNADYTSGESYNRKSTAYYAGFTGRTVALDYQINLRHDRVEVQSSPSNVSKSATTWLMASGYKLTEALKLTALMSTSFRVPNTGELFNTQYTTGNPNLKPEEHKGYEVGLSYATPIGSLRLVHFQSETSNAIAWKSGSPSYENIGLVENSGIEAAFSGVLQGWTYKLASVHQNPINAQTQARLARRARDYGSVDLSKRMMGIDWGAQMLVSGNRVDGSDRLRAYTLVHLMASKKWTPDWTARVKIENAFNESYQLAYGYNTPPRGVFVSLQYQPK